MYVKTNKNAKNVNKELGKVAGGIGKNRSIKKKSLLLASGVLVGGTASVVSYGTNLSNLSRR